MATLSACGPGTDDVREQVEQLRADYRREVRDLEVRQTAMHGSTNGEIQVFKKGDKFHTRLAGPVFNTKSKPGEEVLNETDRLVIHVIYDGRAYWRLMPGDGLSQINAQDAAAFTFRLFWWEGDLQGMRLAGQETVEGRECYVLEFRNSRSSFERLWADRRSLALVKANIKGPGGKALELWGSSYRTIAGRFEMPWRVELLDNGKLVGYIRTTEVLVNQGVDDAEFDPRQTPVPRPTKEEILNGLFPESK